MENRLTSLSDSALREHVLSLRQTERESSIQLLFALIEIEKRKLFLEDGYSSMFSYCTKKLCYSESSAQRRIVTARTLRDYPALLPYLRSGTVNLSTASLISTILTPDSATEVFKAIAGKTQREVEALVTKPVTAPKEVIRPLGVIRPAITTSPSLFDEAKVPTNSQRIRAECRTDLSGIKSEPLSLLAKEARYEIRFSISEEYRRKLSEVELKLSGKFPRGVALEEAFKLLIDNFLKRGTTQQQAPRKVRVKSVHSRSIPTAVRRAVHARDGGRCTFESTDGVRCDSRWDLELDHIVPYAESGASTVENLRLRCRAHNLYSAEKHFGKEVIERCCNRG